MRRNNQRDQDNQQPRQQFENPRWLHEENHGNNSRRGNYTIDSHFNTNYGAYGNEDYDNQGGYNTNAEQSHMYPQGRYRAGGATYSGPDYYGESQGQGRQDNYRSEEQRRNDFQDHIHQVTHSDERPMGNMYQEDYESRERYNRPHNRHHEREWQSNRQRMHHYQSHHHPNDHYNHPDSMRRHDYGRSHYPNPDFFNYRGGDR